MVLIEQEEEQEFEEMVEEGENGDLIAMPRRSTRARSARGDNEPMYATLPRRTRRP